MDSINTQQPERNKEDLTGAEAAAKIKALAEKAQTCFFYTDIQEGRPFAVRPMSAQKVDDDGNIWFLSADDSHKNEEIMKDARVQLLFQGDRHSDIMTLYGTASISRNKEKIKSYGNH